ncbi:GerAB/ArcD/ProY family transporter [Paenibacillus turpanensis]|uniref:GerAB/ArcD/ProY family transporter n=1 Tax=Paenibacillus turpanensis TaxID=2689078 RepID=UPI00140C53D3|nr:endospore germination permease [Paenibacillus turpanensis]
MNTKEVISPQQLFVLILFHQTGTSVVVGIAAEAKQDAWIAVLAATLFGVLIMYMYCLLSRLCPGNNLYEMMEASFGKWAAMLLSLPYILYFFYIASRVLRDFSELLVTDVLPQTPIEAISILFMIAVIYILYLGPEVLARSAQIFLPYFILFLLMISAFLLIGGDIDLQRLRPILADGLQPIAKAVFPTLIGFPFGEAIVITIVMAQFNPLKKLTRTSLWAVVTVGLFLSYHTALKLAVLGPEMAERSTFPLLSAVREVSIANFIERLDALVVFIMMLGILVKISLFFFSGLKGLEYLFRIPYRQFIVPTGLLISIFAQLIAGNFSEHIEEGVKFVPLYLHMPFQIGFPLLLLLILYVKARWKEG